ncbi:hypothetical protein OG21DRAFT_210573 [Imleria badia]|nr:hypothetical protein OG21DRAFT_210573 [Imleria badia]
MRIDNLANGTFMVTTRRLGGYPNSRSNITTALRRPRCFDPFFSLEIRLNAFLLSYEMCWPTTGRWSARWRDAVIQPKHSTDVYRTEAGRTRTLKNDVAHLSQFALSISSDHILRPRFPKHLSYRGLAVDRRMPLSSIVYVEEVHFLDWASSLVLWKRESSIINRGPLTLDVAATRVWTTGTGLLARVAGSGVRLASAMGSP